VVAMWFLFFFQAEDGIRDFHVTGVQTCALPISSKYGSFSIRFLLLMIASLTSIILPLKGESSGCILSSLSLIKAHAFPCTTSSSVLNNSIPETEFIVLTKRSLAPINTEPVFSSQTQLILPSLKYFAGQGT